MKNHFRLVPVLFSTIFLFSILVLSQNLQAQMCNLGAGCVNDSDCVDAACSACVTCTEGTCQANDNFCQTASGMCREGVCAELDINPINPTGCDFSAPAIAGVEGLDDICYVCAPPAVAGVNTCGNGICDSGQGEDCTTCPADCLIAGFTECPASDTDINNQCNGINNSCTDGDLCRIGACITVLACDIGNIVDVTCSGDTSDLCCPAGCQGLPDGIANCEQAINDGLIPDGACDVDCWPLPDCGDGLVENPETCDGNVGIDSNGAPIADGACRDPGAAAQCTFCGDGIIQAEAGEECDGLNDAACGEGSCNSSCTCEDICVTGSGGPVNTIRTNCGNCNLDIYATSQGWLKDYGIFLALLVAAGASWLLRRRHS